MTGSAVTEMLAELVILLCSQQGLYDLHAYSGAALPDVPCSNHAVVLQLHQ